MHLGVRVKLSDNIERDIESRYSKISSYYWGICFNSLTVLREIGVDEIVDPLLDRKILVYAVYLPSFKRLNSAILDVLEKAAIIADELAAKLLVYPVTPTRLELMKKERFLERVFKLISSYYLKLCFNIRHSRQGIRKAFNTISDFTGGVFYFSLESLPENTTKNILEAVDSIFGLLKIIHINEKELVILMNNPDRLLKYYELINHLVQRGFEGFITIDYGEGEYFYRFTDIIEQHIRLAYERLI